MLEILTGIVLLIMVFFAIGCFFAWSMYITLDYIKPEHYLFPNWFAWMMVIPYIGLIFYWLMMPFGVPRAINNHLISQEKPDNVSSKLYGLGLAYAILVTCLMILPLMSGIFGLAALVLLILYWRELVKVRSELV